MLSTNNIPKSYLGLSAALNGHYASSTPAHKKHQTLTSPMSPANTTPQSETSSMQATTNQRTPSNREHHLIANAYGGSETLAAAAFDHTSAAAAAAAAATAAVAATAAAYMSSNAYTDMVSGSPSSAFGLAPAPATSETPLTAMFSPPVQQSPFAGRKALPLSQAIPSQNALSATGTAFSAVEQSASITSLSAAASAAATASVEATNTSAFTFEAKNNANVASSPIAPLAAPRPVSAQQLMPPTWLLAGLQLDVLLGLTAPKKTIINDVFFTQEEHHESPQLTPVSEVEDVRPRPLVPSDEIENFDVTSDLALFADSPMVDPRSVWPSDELESALCGSTRQPSPSPTVTSESEIDTAAVSDPAKFHTLSDHVAQTKPQYKCDDSETSSLSGESCVGEFINETASVRESLRPTMYEDLSHNGIDWCRYCGTTEGINWRPGPWGKRTLCNKHGCDYKGYGFASKMPRLNLKEFADEALEERIRPVLQTFCTVCQKDFSETDNILIHCDGCHRAYHQTCHPDGILSTAIKFDTRWYCEPSCLDNVRRRRIVVELPKCRLPYMCAPRNNNSHAHHSSNSSNGNATPKATDSTQSRSTTAGHQTRSRKRKATRSASPVENSSTTTTTDSPRSKVRKSTRVTRPSTRRLESVDLLI